MNRWEENAHLVETVYGMFVDWDERFYTCPYCGEPIYEDDWSTAYLVNFLCPICEEREEDLNE